MGTGTVKMIERAAGWFGFDPEEAEDQVRARAAETGQSEHEVAKELHDGWKKYLPRSK